MLSKSKVKYIQSLSHKKQRDEDGVFVAEGPKIIKELLEDGGVELVELYVLPEAVGSLAGLPVQKLLETDLRTLEKISFMSTPNQMLGVFRKPPAAALQLPGSVSLMLDNIQDPGNMGTILRCADWFGISQVICSQDCADAFGPKAVQSTMGSVARVKVVYTSLPDLLRSAAEISVCAATLAGTSLYSMQALHEGIIIIGNESKGIGKETLALATTRVTIPRNGRAESLNAAVATGIILSHLMK